MLASGDVRRRTRRPAGARRPARPGAGRVARPGRPAAGQLRPVRAPGHRAVPRLGQRGRAGLPLPRLAVPRRRALRRDTPAGGPGPGAAQGAHRRVRLPGAVRAHLGGAGRAALAAARGAGTGGRDLGPGASGALPVALRRRPPGGELHRLRAFPLGAPGPARGSGPAGRAAPRGPHRGQRAALLHRPAGGHQHRRLPRVRQRAGRPARAAQPVRAAPAVHDRAAPRLGRRAGHGVLLRLPAARHVPGATTTSASRTG